MGEAFAAWKRRRGAPGSAKGMAAAFVILAPTTAWAVALVVNYGLASHACYPSTAPRADFLPGWSNLRLVLATVDLVCLVLCATGLALVAHERRQARAASETAMPERHVQLVLSKAGLMAAALLCLGVAVNGIALWLISTCSLA